MKHKILVIALQDIIIDHKKVAERIDNACHFPIPMAVTGILYHSEKLYLTLEHTKDTQIYKYVIATISSLNSDEITAELSSRAFYGFSFIGGFEFNNKFMGLFKFKPEIIDHNEDKYSLQ